MKNFCLLPVFVLLCPGLEAQKMQKVTEYHFKKLKSCEGQKKGEKKEGTWYCWNRLGEPASKTEYHNNIPDGVYLLYPTSPNAVYVDFNVPGSYKKSLHTQKTAAFPVTYLTSGFYKAGEKNGTWKYYDQDGNLQREENYVQGKLDGLVQYYRQAPYSTTLFNPLLHVVQLVQFAMVV